MASTLLAALLQDWRLLLTEWSLNGILSRAAQDALRLPGEPVALQQLVKRWSVGDFKGLPPVELLPAASMPGAAGAYAISTGTIYLNADWLRNAPTEQVLDVLNEELGHYLDGLMNPSDTPGDEGAIFAALVRAEGLSPMAMAGLKTENDKGWLEVDGLKIGAEFSNPTKSLILTNQSINVAIQDITGNDAASLPSTTPVTNDSTDASNFSAMGFRRVVSDISTDHLTAVGDKLYFIHSGSRGPELWKSDGTDVGTVLVYSWNNSQWYSPRSPNGLIALGNTLLFSADEVVHGRELWKSDGTPLGTTILADIVEGWQSSSPIPLRIYNNTLFFRINATVNGSIIWQSDGTRNGTTQATINDTLYTIGTLDGRTTAVINGEAFFVNGTSDAGYELWKYSSFTRSSSRVADIWPGLNSSEPRDLIAVGSTLFFTADDGTNGRELWRSNGTSSGTVLVADLMPGSARSNPTNLTLFNNSLYFFAGHPTLGYTLWKSDGTAAGTIPVASTVLNNLYNPFLLKVVGSNLVFIDYEHRIWKTDGTADGTMLIANLIEIGYRLNGIAGPFGTYDYTSIGDTIFLSLNSTLGTSLYALNTTETSGCIVNVSLNRASAAEDGANNLVYTFSRSGLVTSALTINYGIAGTADASDYTGAIPGTGKMITFAAGSATATLTIEPTADTIIEADETVSLTLSVGTGYTIGTTAAVTGTISNDDFPVITLVVSPAAVAEDGTTNLIFTFSRTGPTTSALTVNYVITGTADSADYTGAAPGAGKTINFATGSATATLAIDPTADTTIEPDETFALILTAGSGYSIGATAAVVGTISNDDLPLITLAVSPAAVAEDGTSNLIYTFSRTGPTTSALTVNYSISGTADSSDYTGASPGIGKTINFAAGAATATVTVDPTADTTIEPDETVALTLTAGSGYSIGTTAAVVGTILNDDTIIETQGNTKLLKRGDGKAFVEVGGARQEITSPWGSPAGDNSSEWQMLAADTISGVNKILWRNNTSSFLHIWNLDANWTLQSTSGSDAFNSPRASELESSFQVDATRDGIIGSPFTILETQGNTKLLRRANGKALVEYGTGSLQEITSPWNSTAGDNSSEWQMLAADTIGGINNILWRNNTSNFLHIWSLDANWNWQSASGADGFNTAKAWELETSFQVDATRDGIIGTPYTTIEAQGNTKLLRRANGKALVEYGTGTQKEITSPWNSTAGSDSSDWQMLAADTINGVNQVLWRNNTSNFLHSWSLDANWNWQSSSGADGFNTAKAWELETSFQVDATRDGIIGTPFTTI